MIKSQIKESIRVKEQLLNSPSVIGMIDKVSEECINVFKNKGKILLAGNGGSAADSQHISAEFVSRFYFDRPGLPSIALTTDTSALLAIGNDYGFEKVFSRQIEALGSKGDIFIGISTSGNSKNVINALIAANKKGLTTVGLIGENGGKMEGLCTFCIKVPSDQTPRIQEAHILIGHIICAIVEDTIFGQLK
jgi:D-sedoheptulose 7-phosphate isomerase